jgi:glycosyltransferase involved in cell wall biosynthesis
VQSAETYSLLGEISYSHFCHRCYLREHSRTTPVKSLGSLFRWLDHRVRALTEGFVYRRARAIVTPSAGLKRELSRELSLPGSKITVIGNPVDLERFARPTDFDGDAFRQQYGISGRDVVATFTALGHFERKGLPFIFEAMRTLQRPDFKLLIVGGRESLIAEYRRKAEKLGIIESIIFAGMQNDVRPFLWCSDLFLFPSLYEVFPLVVLQTAASGLPILSSKVNGVEEFLVDEENGLYIDASTAGVERGLEKFFSLTPTARLRMGQSARASVAGYSNEHFGRQWARFYAGLELAKGRVWSGRAESSLAKEL